MFQPQNNVRIVVGCAASILLMAGAARGQGCGARWLDGPGARGPSGVPTTSGLWDSDGPGPLPAGPLVFGTTKLGTRSPQNVGTYFDGSAWRVAPMRPWDAFQNLYALAGMRDGSVLAWGGPSTSPGAGARVWRWTSGTWSELPTVPYFAAIDEMGQLASGEPLICGAIGITQANIGVLRWTGAGWEALGQGVLGRVRSMAMVGADLIVGGAFSKAGSAVARNVARWDGVAWNAMDQGLPADEVRFVRSSGSTLVAVTWSTSNLRFYRWNGAEWTETATALTRLASDVQVMSDGSIIVAWSNTGVATSDPVVARWDGSAWTDMAGGVRVQQVVTGASSESYQTAQAQKLLKLDDGTVAVIGRFDLAGATGVDNAARWDGAAWGGLGQGPDGMVASMLELPSGEIVVGGSFRSIGGLPIERVAIWDGGSWRPVGDGFGIAPDSCTEVCALALDERGNLLAATSDVNPLTFLTSNTIFEKVRSLKIWRLEGESWVQLGEDVRSLSGRRRPQIGHASDWSLLVGRSWSESSPAGLLVWDTAAWKTDPGFIAATSFLPDGDQVLIGGDNTGSPVWPWGVLGYVDGRLETSPLSSFLRVTALYRRANGNVLAASGVGSRTTIYQWDGATWTALETWLRGLTPLGTGPAIIGTGFAETPAGEPMVGGYFELVSAPPSAVCDGLAVHRDNRWQAWDPTFTGPVFGLLRTSGGELLVAGGRSIVGGKVSAQFSRWTDDGKPWVVKRPMPAQCVIGAQAGLGARLASGYGVVQYQWERQTESGWAPVVDGPGGAGAGGGIVSGSSGAVDTSDGNEPLALKIADAVGADGGVYRVRVWSGCGQSVTPGARLAVGCNPADVTGDGVIDLDDFMAFFDCWDHTAACADLDADGRVSAEDFFVFFGSFEAGC